MNNELRSVNAGRGLQTWSVRWLAVLLMIPSAVSAQNLYVGSARCAACHSVGPQEGPFQVWQSSAHAGAVRTLANAVVGRDEGHGLWVVKMGRGDQYGLPTPAAESPYCLPCHATAFSAGAKLTAQSFDPKDGVQCESCHGPASAHAEVESIKAAGKAIPADKVAGVLDIAKVATLKHYADEMAVEGQCRTCHDGMCGDFNFAEMWPRARHAVP